MQSLTLRTTLTVAAIAIGSLVHAQETPDGGALFDAMGLNDMMEIMREEGLDYGNDIGIDLLGRDTPEWGDIVSKIYDLDAMTQEVRSQLILETEGDDIETMLDFFTSELGQRIVSLEVAARRALLDDAVDTASKEAAADAAMDETPRFAQLTTFVTTNDLVESNVIGAMNSNFAFYAGLMDGGALPSELTEEQVLRDVYTQEPDIRANTTEWVYSYLLMAYQPLSDAELDSYITFSKSDAGQALNTAMFNAFDGMFEDISRALGLASAQLMQGEDI